MYDDFTFRARHCAALGVHAFWGESGQAGAKLTRNLYELPGGWQAEIGAPSYPAWTRKLTLAPVDGREMDTELTRALLGWLCGAPGYLIADDDRERMWLTRFDGGATLDNRTWPDGCLQITATIQGAAWGVRLQRWSGHTDGGAATIEARLDSQLPSPLGCAITCTSGTITAMEIACEGHRLLLDGLSLAPGSEVRYSAGTGIAAPDLRVDGMLDFGPVSRWAQLTLPPRAGRVNVAVEGGEADVSVWARGRYLA